MIKSTITREQVVALIAEHSYDSALVDALEHLLDTIDSEPVAWTDEAELRDVEKSGCGYLFKANPITPHADPRRVILLYRHAQPEPVVPDNRAITVVLKYTSEPNAFAPWAAKAFYQFHKDTVDSCVKAFSEACNESNIKLEIIYK